MSTRTPTNRRGITLMEVMISIGILAIGLTSVLSIIPAGKSEVSKALIYDRAAALAANALADAATFGLLKPQSAQISGSTTQIAVFDPALNGSGVWGVVTSNTATASGTAAAIRPLGIFATATSGIFTDSTNASAVLRCVTQSRDDVSYTSPASDDALPTNQFPAVGPRAFLGRMSCAIAVTSPTALTPGSFATLSAIVFHNRDLSAGSTLVVSGSWDGSSTISQIALPSDRTLREVMRPGAVVTTGTSFHQLAMTAIDESSGNVFVTFSGPAPGSLPRFVQILLDSVGLAQQTVILEGSGPWSQ